MCTEKFQRICNPYQDNVCRQTYEKICNTLYRDNCFEAFRDVDEPWETEECKDENVKVCEQAWIDQGNAGKVWGDDPATCKYLKETKCQTVTRTRKVKQAYQKCEKVPYQDCKDVPRQVCEFVTKERCNNEPYQVCILYIVCL